MSGTSYESIIGDAILGGNRDLADARVTCKMVASRAMTCACGSVLDQQTVTVVTAANGSLLTYRCPRCMASSRDELAQASGRLMVLTWAEGRRTLEQYLGVPHVKASVAGPRHKAVACARRMPAIKGVAKLLQPFCAPKEGNPKLLRPYRILDCLAATDGWRAAIVRLDVPSVAPQGPNVFACIPAQYRHHADVNMVDLAQAAAGAVAFLGGHGGGWTGAQLRDPHARLWCRLYVRQDGHVAIKATVTVAGNDVRAYESLETQAPGMPAQYVASINAQYLLDVANLFLHLGKAQARLRWDDAEHVVQFATEGDEQVQAVVMPVRAE